MKIKQVSKIFFKDQPNEIKALNHIDLDIINQGLVVISGESGAGKTTLLNVLSGLDTIDAGEIEPKIEGRKGGYIFQDFQLFNDKTVFENLKIVLELKSSYDETLINKVLKDLGMLSYSKSNINQLSGGQKQRVAIARALLLNYNVLYCDEPTGNLDKKNKVEIANILKEISKKKLVIVVSHDDIIWESIFDQKIVMDDGKISNNIIRNNTDCSIEKSANDDTMMMPWSLAFRFAFSSIKKHKVKNISLFLILLLSFCSLILAMSISFNSNTKSTYRYLKAFETPFLNYMKINKINEGDYDLRPISTKDALNYNEKYGTSMYYEGSVGYTFNDYTMKDDGFLIERILLSNTYDGVVLLDDQVVITDAMADILLNISKEKLQHYDDLLGQKLQINGTDVIITHISTTKRKHTTDYSNEYRDMHQMFIIVNDTTFDKIKLSKKEDDVPVMTIMGKYEHQVYINKVSNDIKIAFGRLADSANEIVISVGFAQLISNDNEYKDILNKEITITFAQKGQFEENYDKSKQVNFVVAGITLGYGRYIYMDTDIFNQTVKNYNMRNLDAYMSRGIYIMEYDQNIIEKLNRENIFHATYMSAEISNSIHTLERFSILMYVIAIVFLLITLLLFINTVSTNVINRKNEIGILRSMYVSFHDISKVFLADIIILVGITMLVSFIGSTIIVYQFNKILLSQSVVAIMWVNYNILMVLGIFLFSFIFAMLLQKIQSLKLQKISTVDILYER